jgi:hypothetical protein
MILASTTANAWTLRLLLTQLYDPAMDVCEMATHFLEEACDSMDVLRLVVAMQPTLDHLGEVGHGLLLRWASTRIDLLRPLTVVQLHVYADGLQVFVRRGLHCQRDGPMVSCSLRYIRKAWL